MASPLISLKSLTATVGSHTLFQDLSFGVHEKERIGLIGPNGAGKSTLLKVLAKNREPESGEVIHRKNLDFAYLQQSETYTSDLLAADYITQELTKSKGLSALDAQIKAETYLSLLDFKEEKTPINKLSGGWAKKLSIANCLAKEADLLILDEPTNHLDWESILWLEQYLKSKSISYILVSHDRDFLNNTTNKIIEINKTYANGFLAQDETYYNFLEKRSALLEAQLKEQSALQNRVKRETEWLRAGVKARTTKNQGRIKEANELIGKLDKLEQQNRATHNKTSFQIDDTKRQTKKVYEINNLSVQLGEKKLLTDYSKILSPKTKLALVGKNGSGKTSFIKTLLGEITPAAGKIKQAQDLKVLYYEQKKEHFPEDQNLMQYLGEGSDYVVFKDSSIHVASYASKFLFDSEKMSLPLKQLSGGEKAKLSLAKALLSPADILILDEPTNDLDVESIELLESILKNFNGLYILVSHDRKFLSNLCNDFLYLNGDGNWAHYADLNQALRALLKKDSNKTAPAKKETNLPKPQKKKLSYKDKKFLEDVESIIASEESKLTELQKNLEQAVQESKPPLIVELSQKIADQQRVIDQTYERWERLES